MSPIEDHPQRYDLANELHARPFPALEAPCHAVYLAIKQPKDAASRDRAKDREHLIALLERFGGPQPKPGATHYFGPLGQHQLKWEQHTEFVTYTIFVNGVSERPFDKASYNVFPEDWLADAPGARITSAFIRVEPMVSNDDVRRKLTDWFVPESLAVSRILDDTAIMAGDFRIDAGGHMRFAAFVEDDTGPRRVGRIVQRICEIETYKTMSMLGLSRARTLGPKLGEIDSQLNVLMDDMTGTVTKPDSTLKALLAISAELETLIAKSAFRFGATGAYEAIVNQRIEVMREGRFEGRQTFAEFMMRRFDPAMRTVKSTERRMQAMSDRAIRAGDLLRTRVDVERSAQNQQLLSSMDKRADLQLRLQKTVEGLSTVAISYYAVNLAVYALGPFAEGIGVSKTVLAAIATPIVLLGVWALVRRVRNKME